MHVIQPRNILAILTDTLNAANPQLAEHGRRVSYTLYRILKKASNYDDKQIRNICIMSLLHDIGIYMKDKDIINSSYGTSYYTLYGYFFMKELSPIENYAPVILYHHFENNSMRLPYIKFSKLSRVIYTVNAVDNMATQGASSHEIARYVEGQNLDPSVRNMIVLCYKELSKMQQQMLNDAGFNRLVLKWQPPAYDSLSYAMMAILLIDFKSSFTVDHTIAASSTSRILAELMGVPLPERMKIYTGSLLHDLGKAGIPLAILDKPGKLSKSETQIMRSHVDITESILKDKVDGDILDIATRHHEKLDGSGYGKGLDANSLTLSDQLVTVGDIFSALISNRSYKPPFTQEQVVQALHSMGNSGLINSAAADIAADNYEYIVSQIRIDTLPIREKHNNINNNMELYSIYLDKTPDMQRIKQLS